MLLEPALWRRLPPSILSRIGTHFQAAPACYSTSFLPKPKLSFLHQVEQPRRNGESSKSHDSRPTIPPKHTHLKPKYEVSLASLRRQIHLKPASRLVANQIHTVLDNLPPPTSPAAIHQRQRIYEALCHSYLDHPNVVNPIDPAVTSLSIVGDLIHRQSLIDAIPLSPTILFRLQSMTERFDKKVPESLARVLKIVADHAMLDLSTVNALKQFDQELRDPTEMLDARLEDVVPDGGSWTLEQCDKVHCRSAESGDFRRTLDVLNQTRRYIASNPGTLAETDQETITAIYHRTLYLWISTRQAKHTRLGNKVGTLFPRKLAEDLSTSLGVDIPIPLPFLIDWKIAEILAQNHQTAAMVYDLILHSPPSSKPALPRQIPAEVRIRDTDRRVSSAMVHYYTTLRARKISIDQRIAISHLAIIPPTARHAVLLNSALAYLTAPHQQAIDLPLVRVALGLFVPGSTMGETLKPDFVSIDTVLRGLIRFARETEVEIFPPKSRDRARAVLREGNSGTLQPSDDEWHLFTDVLHDFRQIEAVDDVEDKNSLRVITLPLSSPRVRRNRSTSQIQPDVAVTAPEIFYDTHNRPTHTVQTYQFPYNRFQPSRAEILWKPLLGLMDSWIKAILGHLRAEGGNVEEADLEVAFREVLGECRRETGLFSRRERRARGIEDDARESAAGCGDED